MSMIESSLDRAQALHDASMGAGPHDDPEDEVLEAQRPDPQAREGTAIEQLRSAIGDLNLARRYDTETLDRLANTVVEEFTIDDQSRKAWEDDTNKAMKMALQVTEPKTFPWPDAANVVFPLIGTATLQFGARTYGTVVQDKGVVKGLVWGSDHGTPVTGSDGQPIMDHGPDNQPVMGPNGQPQPVWLIEPGGKRKRADRIGEFMSWQLLEQIEYWEDQTDQLLHQIPITGGAVRKTYWDYSEERPQSYFVSLMNLVWNKNAPSFETAPRHSERVWLYPNEITDLEQEDLDERGEGVFLTIPYAGAAPAGPQRPSGFSDEAAGDAPGYQQNDPWAPQEFIEQHRRYDLDGDGYAEPLIVTVHRQSVKTVRVVAGYDEEGIKLQKRKDEAKEPERLQKVVKEEVYTLLPFLPSLDGGSYPTGWGQLLRAMNEAINTTINQLLDAGTLANSNSGFLASDIGLPSGDVSLGMGRWKRVVTRGMSVRDAVFPMPFKEPSMVLFQLLGFLVSCAKEVAGIQEVLTGEAGATTAQPTTILAMIEQGLKVYTAIVKRLFRGFKKEYQKLFKLNAKHINDKTGYRLGDEWREISVDDFKQSGGVAPIADPSMATDMQRLTRAQLLLSFRGQPDVKQDEILRRVFDAANIERPDELIQPPQPNPIAPILLKYEMDTKQAELGRLRAAEQKDTTQAFLNLALARAKASGPEEAQIAQQMDYLRLKIEAINALTRAAAEQHQHHKNMIDAAGDHADRILDTLHRARESAIKSGVGGGVEPTPGPTGPFPVATAGPQPVPSGGNNGGNVPPVAPPSSNVGLPPLPGGPPGG